MNRNSNVTLIEYNDRSAARVSLSFLVPNGSDPDSAQAQLQVFADAFAIYLERNVSYKDNWRKMGWKGTLVRLKERVDRLWDRLWTDSEHDNREDLILNKDLDDAIDLINFAAFLIRGTVGGEATASGEWKW